MAKRITYKITDPAAFQTAYPELVKDEQIVVKKYDKKRIRKLVNLNWTLEREVPGMQIIAPNTPAQIDLESAKLKIATPVKVPLSKKSATKKKGKK